MGDDACLTHFQIRAKEYKLERESYLPHFLTDANYLLRELDEQEENCVCRESY